MLLSSRDEGARGERGVGPSVGIGIGVRVGVGVGRRNEELTRTVASLCSNPHIPYDHRGVTSRVSSGMGASGGEREEGRRGSRGEGVEQTREIVHNHDMKTVNTYERIQVQSRQRKKTG
jgi:hypothetical protein